MKKSKGFAGAIFPSSEHSPFLPVPPEGGTTGAGACFGAFRTGANFKKNQNETMLRMVSADDGKRFVVGLLVLLVGLGRFEERS
jgi:hypothetical protein